MTDLNNKNNHIAHTDNNISTENNECHKYRFLVAKIKIANDAIMMYILVYLGMISSRYFEWSIVNRALRNAE